MILYRTLIYISEGRHDETINIQSQSQITLFGESPESTQFVSRKTLLGWAVEMMNVHLNTVTCIKSLLIFPSLLEHIFIIKIK